MKNDSSTYSDLSCAESPPPVRALRIVGGDAAPLGKTQKRFNKLLARIEKLRRDRASAVGLWEAALAEHARCIHPLDTEMHGTRRALVLELERFWRTPKGIGKRQRGLLRDLLLLQFDHLALRPPGPDDEALIQLRDELEEALEAETKVRFKMLGRDGDGDEDDDGGDFAFDGSKLRPGMTPEEIMQEISRQMFGGEDEVDGAGGDEAESPFGDEPRPPRQERGPTAAQMRKEKREAELQEARKRGVATIYKQLAKVLHPDLEQDPERRLEKERLMQDLTVAYRAGDLHTLLRLELEFIHREQGDLNHLGEEKLKIYCELLAEQVTELTREVDGVPYDPRYNSLRTHMQPFDRRQPDWPRIEHRLRGMIRDVARSVILLRGAEARAELGAMLKAFSEQRRQRARRPIFPDFF